MESYLLNKEFIMPQVLAYDTPIRPIKPGDRQPAPAERPAGSLPAPASFFVEWRRILMGRLGR
jgi:hypothetical protein